MFDDDINKAGADDNRINSDDDINNIKANNNGINIGKANNAFMHKKRSDRNYNLNINLLIITIITFMPIFAFKYK